MWKKGKHKSFYFHLTLGTIPACFKDFPYPIKHTHSPNTPNIKACCICYWAHAQFAFNWHVSIKNTAANTSCHLAIDFKLKILTYPSIQQRCDNIFAWKPLNCSSFSSSLLHNNHIGFGCHWNRSDFGCSSLILKGKEAVWSFSHVHFPSFQKLMSCTRVFKCDSTTKQRQHVQQEFMLPNSTYKDQLTTLRTFLLQSRRMCRTGVIHSVLVQSAPSHELQSRLMQVSQSNTSNFSKARVRRDKGNTNTQVKVLFAQISWLRWLQSTQITSAEELMYWDREKPSLSRTELLQYKWPIAYWKKTLLF